ncbi:hypothetical protein ACKKBG_A35370 [Auxenochlorella protothecoides x Auxenochlorella symbiontica]
MIEVVLNDRLGKKVRVKCNEDDTIGDLKKLVAAQTGTRPEKLRIQKWYTVYKDHITLADYEREETHIIIQVLIHNGRRGPCQWKARHKVAAACSGIRAWVPRAACG